VLRLGKCPECGQELDGDDVDDLAFRGTIRAHYAYRCRKCDTVIGFSSYAKVA
jgi:hypothetical protein